MSVDIKSLTKEQLKEAVTALGCPSFRAAQIGSWLDNGCTSFDEMNNLPLSLRQQLAEQFYIPSVTVLRKLQSQQDETVKYLFRLYDGELVESVLMSYEHGNTLCISFDNRHLFYINLRNGNRII